MQGTKLVIILNGKPRAGKDTFAEIMNDYISVYKYSSIDKVKSIALDCGWKGGKEEKDRKFLSELKRITTEYSDMAYNDILEKIEAFDNDEISEKVFIVDVREPEEIDRLEKATGAITVFLNNDNVPDITSNYADANVANYDYDIVLDNSGTLEDLRDTVKSFLCFLMTTSAMNDEEGDEE